ncbi:MAG: head-tail adaptor protein [Roseibium sp.]
MSAGTYRVPVLLQRPVETSGAGGAVSRDFVAAGTAFASLKLKRQTERFDDEQLGSRRTYEISLRPFSGLKGGWRIVAGSRVFRVLSIADPTMRNRQWICEAEEEGT